MQALGAGEWVFFAGVIFLSYAIRGSAGFGGVTVPLLAQVLSLKILAPLVAFLGLFSSLAILRHDWRDVVWRDIARIMPWCLGGVAAGLYLFKSLDARALARALGAFVLLYGGYTLWRSVRPPRSPSAPLALVTPVLGTAGGFIGTIFGTNAGTFFAVYLDLLGHAKRSFRATVAAILLGLGIARVSGYVAVGAYERETLVACAAALPIMLAGAFAGNRLHASLNQLLFQRLVGIILMASGIPLLLR